MTNQIDPQVFIQAMASLRRLKSHQDGADEKQLQAELNQHRKIVMETISSLHEGDIDPWMGKTITVLIRKSTRYIVYLDERLDVQWWWSERTADEENLNVVQANVTRLSCASEFLLAKQDDLRIGAIRQSRPWGWLRCLFLGDIGKVNLAALKLEEAREIAKGIRSLIAESMAMVLNEGSQADCEKVLSMAEQQILIKKDQMCRGYFFWQFALATSVVAGMTIALLSEQHLLGEQAATIISVSKAALAGAFGAFVSAMARTRELALEPESGKKGLRAEAYSRALIGAGAAILVYFAFDAGIILKGALGNNAPATESIKMFLCLAAGASERILPNLIGRAESLIDGDFSPKQKGPQKKKRLPHEVPSHS